jgi:hypothetical protein
MCENWATEIRKRVGKGKKGKKGKKQDEEKQYKMTKVKRTHQERKTDEDACEVKEIDGD